MSRLGITGTVASAALPALMATTDPESRGDQFYGPKRILGALRSSETALDSDAEHGRRRRLWEESERLVGVRFAA